MWMNYSYRVVWLESTYSYWSKSIKKLCKHHDRRAKLKCYIITTQHLTNCDHRLTWTPIYIILYCKTNEEQEIIHVFNELNCYSSFVHVFDDLEFSIQCIFCNPILGLTLVLELRSLHHSNLTCCFKFQPKILSSFFNLQHCSNSISAS